MNMASFAVSIGLGVVALALPAIGADIGPTDRLLATADAVVVARVQSGTQTGYIASFALSVESTIKGPLSAGGVVAATWSTGLSASRDLTGGYGLWFLKQGTGGQWNPLALGSGQIPFEMAYVRLSSGAAVPATAAGSSSPTASDFLAVQLASALPYHSTSVSLYDAASALLGLAETPTTLSVLRTFSSSGDPAIRFVGLTGLVGTGPWSPLAGNGHNTNVSRLLEARWALSQIAANIASTASPQDVSVLVGHAVAIVRDANAGTVAALGEIAASNIYNVQRGAAFALREIHTSASLPLLAQLMNSSDPWVRECGMSGLSRFVDGMPTANPDNMTSGKDLVRQGPTPYRTPATDQYDLSGPGVPAGSEAAYLQFWKTWWSANQATLAPPAQ